MARSSTVSSVPTGRQVFQFALDDCSVRFVAPDRPSDGSATDEVRTGTAHYVAFGLATCMDDSSNRSRLPNNQRSQQFALLAGAIAKLSNLSPSNEYYLKPEARDRATELLGLLHTQTDITPPKLFPQDEETLGLTWTKGRFMRLLSVEEGELSLMDIDKKSQYRCPHEINQADGLYALLPALGLLPKVSTAS